jgi:hypothetical protein
MASHNHGQEPGAGLAESDNRRPYDPERRRAAEILETRNPDWLVMYGPYSRLLWAWSRFATRDGKSILVASRDPTELDERMRILELERSIR